MNAQALTRATAVSRHPLRSYQRGVAFPVALLMLMVLLIGATAMVRNVDTAVQVSGNLAFKQAATMGADRGISTAVAWLTAQGGAGLHNSNAAAGYCSSLHAQDLTLTGWDPVADGAWTAACTPVALAADASGNQVEYLIHRLCAQPDRSPTLQPGFCSTASGAAVGFEETSSRRSGRDLLGTTVINVAYRITVRVQSPGRSGVNNRSFVQATVLIPDA